MAVRAPDVTIRAARPADAPAIRGLAGLVPSTPALLDHILQAADRVSRVATSGGRVVGFACASFGAGEAHVLDVAVDPDVRRRGVATALLADLIAGLRDAHGVGAVTLEVRPSNAGARALYRRLGFEEAGERPGYYPDGGPDGGGEAAVIMWRRPL